MRLVKFAETEAEVSEALLKSVFFLLVSNRNLIYSFIEGNGVSDTIRVYLQVYERVYERGEFRYLMERLSIFKCAKCGSMVEVLHAGNGALSCCGESMRQMKENTTDAAQEKHVPVFDGSAVKVGSVTHPMAEEHYIEWIELIDGDKICRQFLKPGEEPRADFTGAGRPKVTAREYCNLHGLWKGER